MDTTTTTLPGDVPEIPVIELVQPMPGFPGLARFALVQVDDDGVLCSLTSLDEPGLRFLVVPPNPFFPDYAPEVDESVLVDLGSSSVDDLVVLCVLTAGESLASTTANLAAPVVLDTSTHRALQVVLDDPGLSVATPLIA
ncbi:flagellar assembly protein FliW [Nocardioides sp. J2M5]|uniref:flagellar assembly protein FliW n=1 Tax=Nocardioides palaemonis TaxID=2829810 RepID=UPI001BACA125|nr:flagellar assembly protein FliW [Nocardioides palaemonis]MBS2940019.1 flagellar assembly protein FliW [Nocardioides palaemonis]